jgi:hypothetical protein
LVLRSCREWERKGRRKTMKIGEKMEERESKEKEER